MLAKSFFAAFALCAAFATSQAQAEVIAAADTEDGYLISLTDEGEDVCQPVAAQFDGRPFYLVNAMDGKGNKEEGCWTLLDDGQVGVQWGDGTRVVYPAYAFRDSEGK